MADVGKQNEQSNLFDEGIDVSVADLQLRIRDFLKEYLSERSRETVGTYRRSLNEFSRWYVRPGTNCRFRSSDIEAYKTYLMEEKGLHQVSVSTYLTAVRRLCQYMVDIGLLKTNPASSVKGNRRPNSHSRKALREEEVRRLISSLPADSEIDLRDRAMIFLMLYGGMSEIELVRADVQDLEQTLLGWYLRTQGKGHTVKDQQVRVDQNVINAIRLYLDARSRIRPEDPLFVSHGHRSDGQRLNTRSVRSRINHHLEVAGVKKPGISPHSLTHTAALIWLNEGMSLESVKHRMRHGTLDTTMIYFKKQGLLSKSD
jgi:integrase/recombinase XerC